MYYIPFHGGNFIFLWYLSDIYSHLMSGFLDVNLMILMGTNAIFIYWHYLNMNLNAKGSLILNVWMLQPI